MPDGSIRIKTRIDNNEAKKDAKEFEKIVNNAAENAKDSGDKATINLDVSQAEKEIKRLEKEIEKYTAKISQLESGKLGEYNAEREALNKSTKADLAKATSPDQRANVLAMHDTTMAQIESKYSSVLAKADEYGKIIAQNDAKIQQLRNAIDKIKSSQSKVNSEQSKANTSTSKTTAQASRLSEMLKSAKNTAAQFARSLGVTAYNGIKKVGGVIKNTIIPGLKRSFSHLKNMRKQTSDISKGFMRTGLALLGIEGLMTGVRQIVTSALNDNEKLQNQLTAIKGILGQALTPVINGIVTALTNVVTLVDKVYQAFTGTSLIAKYNAQQADKLADSTSDAADAAKEYNKQLAGFDVANKFSDNTTSSGSSGSADSAATFEPSYSESVSKFAQMIKEAWEQADFTSVGNTISAKLVSMLQNIDWDNIKSKGFGAGKSFATLINGLFGYTDKDGNTLATSVGKTIGESFNTIVSTAKGFASNLKWDLVGSEFANGLLKTISTIDWKNAGETIHDFITGLCNSIAAFFDELSDGDKGYETIKNAVTDFFDGLQIGDITLSVLEATVSILNFSFNILGNLLDDIIQSICDRFGWEWDGTWMDMGPLGIRVPKINFKFGSDDSKADDDGLSWWDKLVDFFGKNSPIIAAIGGGTGEGTVTTTIRGNISDSFTKLKENWDSISEKGKEAATTIKGSVDSTFTKLKEKWDSIKNKINTSSIKGSIQSTFNTLKSKWDSIKSKTNTASIKGSIQKTFNTLKSKWDSIKNKTNTATIKGSISRTFNTALSKWNSLKSKAVTVTTKLKDGITSGIQRILNSLVSMVNKVITALNKIPGINISRISPPRLAKGGIVNNPGRGVTVTAGEAGAEAILPLDNNTGWMDVFADKVAQRLAGGEQTIYVYSILDGKVIGKTVAKYNRQQKFIKNGGTV